MRTARVPSAPILAAIVGLSIVGSPRPASAEWPEGGRVISSAPNDQLSPKAATDGAEGAIFVWQDARSAKVNVFARRVLASGELDPAWPVDGAALLADSASLAGASGGQRFPVIVSDGAGGAIVAWQDDRSQASGTDVFAQHVLASGAVDPAWPANGLALCTAPGQQGVPRIVSDGAGGAIVTWMDARSGETEADVFAQHVLASGAVDPAWPVNGLALCTAPSLQLFPEIATDGTGGAIVTWYDFRPSASGTDVYAQHVTGAGLVDPAWPVNGRALTLAPSSQVEPRIVSDGAGGAIVTWVDARTGAQDIFAQRVLGTGEIAPGWAANGVAISTDPEHQEGAVLTSDGAGGAIVAWEDARSGTHFNIFAQHVLASGAVDAAWPVNGRALSLSSGHQTRARLVVDGSGGAIAAWEEDFFIVVQHVQASGQLDPTFPADGRFVRLNLDFELTPDLVAAGKGTAIVTWSNKQAAPGFDIYAMIVLTGDVLDVDPPPASGITFAPTGANPANGPLTFRFALPRQAGVRLAVYDPAGRRVRELLSGTQPAGEHSVAWDLRDDRGRPVGAGLYLARFEAEGRSLVHKVATLR